MLSMLSITFNQLGHCGSWDTATGRGNPIDSAEIRAHRAAYRADPTERGYQEGSAVLVTEGTHRALKRAPDQEAAQPVIVCGPVGCVLDTFSGRGRPQDAPQASDMASP